MSPLRKMLLAYIREQADNYVIAEFRKRDGSQRVMSFAPAEAAEHLNPDATEKGKAIAQATMAANPHLLRVWSFEDEGYRTVNLNTVNKLTTRDGVLLFARDPDFHNVNIIIEK